MSLAIKWGDTGSEDSGLIYFDAITAYTQNYTGQVTKHPIDSGSSITDHYIKNNPTFSLTGVITGVDVSTGSYLIQDNDGNSPMNTRPAPDAISVNSTDDSILSKFLPSVIGQFLPFQEPDVSYGSTNPVVVDQVRDALIELTSGTKLNEKTGQLDSNIQVVQLFEYNGQFLNRVVNNLVITAVSFKEDADSGHGAYSLYCDISFEQVTFVELKKTKVAKKVKPVVKKKAAPKKSLGKCDSVVKSTTSATNTDPATKKKSIDNVLTNVDQIRSIPL